MMRRLFPLLLMFAAGCAAQAPVPAAPPTPPSATTGTAPSPTSGGSMTRPRGKAAVDSLPSQDALSVLGRIPEPLTAAESVDPPARRQMPAPIAPPPSPTVPIVPAPREDGGPVLAPKAAYDTLRATTESESVPVPSSTRPLGVPARPDSIPPPPPSAPPAAAEPAVATPDTCWRIQVAAPSERVKAVEVQSAARSLLLVPMVIVRDAGRYKVRNEECLPRAGAMALRDRALAAGFDGVFLVRELGPRR